MVAGFFPASSAVSTTRRWVRLVGRVPTDIPLAVLDAVMVIASFMMLLFVRFNGHIPGQYSEKLFRFLPMIVAVHLATNLIFGVYGRLWRHASVAEAARICLAGSTAGAINFALNTTNRLGDFPVPRSVALMGAFGATGLMG